MRKNSLLCDLRKEALKTRFKSAYYYVSPSCDWGIGQSDFPGGIDKDASAILVGCEFFLNNVFFLDDFLQEFQNWKNITELCLYGTVIDTNKGLISFPESTTLKNLDLHNARFICDDPKVENIELNLTKLHGLESLSLSVDSCSPNYGDCGERLKSNTPNKLSYIVCPGNIKRINRVFSGEQDKQIDIEVNNPYCKCSLNKTPTNIVRVAVQQNLFRKTR